MDIKSKWEYFALGIVFLIAICIRLYYVHNTSAYSHDAYFSIRQIENIVSTGAPIYHDNLSYSGRDFFVLPFSYYVMAFFRLFLSEKIAFLIIPNIIASFLVIIVFLIAYEVTKNKISALFSGILIAVMPVYVSKTIISLSPVLIAVILFFLCIYFFMKYEENIVYMWLFLMSFVLLLFTHEIAYLLIFGLLVYLLFLKLENLKHVQEDVELVLFSLLASLWIFFIVFKKPLLIYGPLVIWENLPKALVEQFYVKFNMLAAVYQCGVAPFLMGLYAIFLYFFQRKKKGIYFLISVVLVIFSVTSLGFVQFETSLILLSILLALLSAQTFVIFVNYLKKTYFANFIWLFILTLFAVGIVLSVAATDQSARMEILNVPDENEIQAMEWLSNTPEDSVIAAPLNFGHLITSIGKRENVMDSAFLLAPDVNQRYEDLIGIYDKYKPETEAVNVLNKYGVTYIVYVDDEPDYTKDGNCFKLVFDNNIKIYKLTCRVEEYE